MHVGPMPRRAVENRDTEESALSFQFLYGFWEIMRYLCGDTVCTPNVVDPRDVSTLVPFSDSTVAHRRSAFRNPMLLSPHPYPQTCK